MVCQWLQFSGNSRVVIFSLFSLLLSLLLWEWDWWLLNSSCTSWTGRWEYWFIYKAPMPEIKTITTPSLKKNYIKEDLLIQPSNTFPETSWQCRSLPKHFTPGKQGWLGNLHHCFISRSSTLLWSGKWLAARTALPHATYIKLADHFLSVTLQILADDPFAYLSWGETDTLQIPILCLTND